MSNPASSPLAAPTPDSAAAIGFLRHFGLLDDAVLRNTLSGRDAARAVANKLRTHGQDDDERLLVLTAVSQAFTTLPYENLTRIIRYHQEQLSPFRAPDVVVVDHIACGAGGTCFSLTSALLHVVRWLGFDAEPLLADRRYGQNTHSALLVRIDGRPHLLDPGYLVNRPLPLDEITSHGAEVATDFNRIVLRQEGEGRLQLLTRLADQPAETYRLTFKTRPAAASEFLDAWRTSFGSDILHKPLLTKVAGGKQFFLNARRLQIRGRDESAKRLLNDDELFEEIVRGFGLSPQIARQALQILHRQGDLPRLAAMGAARSDAPELGGLPALRLAGDERHG